MSGLLSTPTPKPGAYLIFGPPGTGKTTVANTIHHLGFLTIDTDRDTQLSAWVNIVTGRQLETRHGFPLAQNWINTHRWRWDHARFSVLVKSSEYQPLFLCGEADNISEFFPHFRRRFALIAPNSVVAARLMARDPKRWNDTDPDLRHILEYNTNFADLWESNAIHFIDATRPVTDIAMEILTGAAK